MAVVITKRRKAYNVIYTIQNENGDIEKRYETFYNREQALKRKEQIDGGKRNKIIVNKNTLFIDYLNQYVSVIIFNDYSISIYENKQSLINNYLSKVVGDKKVKELNAKTSKQIMHDLQLLPGVPLRNQISNDVICASAVRGCLNLLCQASDYLVDHNLMKLNYFTEYRPKVSAKNQESPSWNLSYWTRLISNCTNEKLFILLHLCFDSGLSLSEVRAITWSNLDHLEEGYIVSNKRIRRLNKNIVLEMDPSSIIQTYKKKGFQNTNTVVVLLKNKQEKKVYLHSQVIELLMEWRNRYAQNRCDDSTIFSLKDDLPYDDRVVNKHFKELISKLGFPELTLVKLMSFGRQKGRNEVLYSDVYYSSLRQPLRCKKPNIDGVRDFLNCRQVMECKEKWNQSFKEKTSGLLLKEEHSDFDALVDKLKSDPSLKRELLNKLLEKR